jgi:hypothetical protein
LEEKREAPRVVVIDEATKIVNPHTGCISSYIASEFNACELSAVMRRLEIHQHILHERKGERLPWKMIGLATTYRNFRLVDWHDGGESTNAKTSNDTTDYHHGNACCTCLKSAANEEHNRAIKDSLSAAENITNTSHKKGRYECSDFENRNYGANGSPRGLVEIVFEVPATASVSHVLVPISVTGLSSRSEIRTL